MTSFAFQGTERFEVLGCLGSGAFGEVYRVHDRKLHTVVALKTLYRANPDAIFRFKKEFRALADVSHPNLVQLYELLSEDDQWFFTMELVEGVDFTSYAHRQGDPPSGDPRSDVSDDDVTRPLPIAGAATEGDFDRLRQGFRQLAEGLSALHQTGKLHRDIKPSNIRVTPRGRVVLLDFGLVKELTAGDAVQTVAGGVLGSPVYMAPEQAAGKEVTRASDWYAAGVVLYEALVGQPPFAGRALRILLDKQQREPTPPLEIAPELPQDLGELCRELLSRDSSKRPSGSEVLRRLGKPPARRDAETASATTDEMPFLGRRVELETLLDAFRRSRGERPVIALVHGSSGIGKTSLIHHFIATLRAGSDEPLIFKGRCYERESVPYKALDALIDSLCLHLAHLPAERLEELLPADILALARLFPALRQVKAVARAGRQVLEIPGGREKRRRARAALRELLRRLTLDRPAVLAVDDLQWGDQESADFLAELFRPPDPLPLLLVLSFRREEREASAFLGELLGSAFVRESAEIVEVPVDELGDEAAAELALHLLGGRSPTHRSLAATITGEARGSPFFVAELTRYAQGKLGDEAPPPSGSDTGMTLANLIRGRLEQLPPEAGRLLAVVSLGQRLDLGVALEVAALAGEAQAALAALRAARLVRVRRSGTYDEIESYHDRIREFVAGTLDRAAAAEIHRRLAVALELAGRADFETLAAHSREAGDREREARYVFAAADRASKALAFDRAARLYRTALDLDVFPAEESRLLRIKLGDALANAGRGAEAAAAYLEVADASDRSPERGGVESRENVELLRRAAEQQLINGYVDEGLATIRRVLAAVGMSMPGSRAGILGSIARHRLRLRLRGLKFEAREAGEIPGDQLLRIDICRSVANGLSHVDPLRSLDFGTRHLLLALEAGEPYRVSLAVTWEAAFTAAGGSRNYDRTQRLLATATRLAERAGHPAALGLSRLGLAIAAWYEARGERAVGLFERAEKILRERCTGVAWELATLQDYKTSRLMMLGRLRRVSEELPAAIKDATERGDIYGEAMLRSRTGTFMRLVADQPDEAAEEMRRLRADWSQEGCHIQTYLQLIGRVEIALYRGDPAGAWAALEETWPELVRSQLLRLVEMVRLETLFLRCRGALGASLGLAGSAPGRRAARVLRRSVRRLGRERHVLARPYSRLIRAGVASAAGRRDEAIDQLATAEAEFDALPMGLYAAVSRRRRGQLLGGEHGRRLVAEAERWMESETVRNAERMADTLAPGVWTAREAADREAR